MKNIWKKNNNLFEEELYTFIIQRANENTQKPTSSIHDPFRLGLPILQQLLDDSDSQTAIIIPSLLAILIFRFCRKKKKKNFLILLLRKSRMYADIFVYFILCENIKRKSKENGEPAH
jgi:hypothetical protein